MVITISESFVEIISKVVDPLLNEQTDSFYLNNFFYVMISLLNRIRQRDFPDLKLPRAGGYKSAWAEIMSLSSSRGSIYMH